MEPPDIPDAPKWGVTTHPDHNREKLMSDRIKELERELELARAKKLSTPDQESRIEVLQEKNGQLRAQLSDVQADNAKLRIWKEYVEMNSKEAGYMADEFMKTLKPTQDKGIIFEEASDVTEDMFQPTQDGR